MQPEAAQASTSPAAALPQPETCPRRSDRAVDDLQHRAGQLIEIDLIPDGPGKTVQHLLGIVFRPEETPVDPTLDPPAHRVEQRREHQCRDHGDDRRPESDTQQAGEHCLESHHAPEIKQGQQPGHDRVLQRPADDEVDVIQPVPEDGDGDRDRKDEKGKTKNPVTPGIARGLSIC